MSKLGALHQLLKEEYAASQHIWWKDEVSKKLVNDVSYTLGLIVKTARCLRRGEDHCWAELVAYCLSRSMSCRVMVAIGEYLAGCGALAPLPLIDLSEQPYRNWRGRTVALFDETANPMMNSRTERPEGDREMAFKREHNWSDYEWRMEDRHPKPKEKRTTNKSIHWLF